MTGTFSGTAVSVLSPLVLAIKAMSSNTVTTKTKCNQLELKMESPYSESG